MKKEIAPLTYEQFITLIGASPFNAIVKTIWDTLEEHQMIIVKKNDTSIQR